MEWHGCLRLRALAGRGPLCLEGSLCDRFRVEVLGQALHISGRSRLDFSLRTDRPLPWREYRYLLEAPAAEALLAALERDFGPPPEAALRDAFEFADPRMPLAAYLDRLAIPYTYSEDHLL